MKIVQRTVRIPIELLSDSQWLDLRKLAFSCSRYGNHLLNESYLKAKGWPRPENAGTAYRDFAEMLSAAVRDAVSRECVGIWRRLGRKILRGEQTLAKFSSDRALVVRDRGIAIQIEDANFIVYLTAFPKGKGDHIRLPVYMPALKRDKMLAELLPSLSPTKATVLFERPGRKIFLLASYEKSVPEPNEMALSAELRYNDSGELWIACQQRKLNLTSYIYLLRSKKAQFAGIQRRLRSCLGKSGNRRKLRRALMARQNYEQWSDGPIKQLAAAVSKWCEIVGAGSLTATVPVKEEFESSKSWDAPWSRIVSAINNRCESSGISFRREEPSEDLKRDWKRIAGMLEAYKKFQSFGPPYDAVQ